MNQGFAMSRRGRPRLAGNRFPGGKFHTEPANAVGAWRRQIEAVNELVLEPFWGSAIAKLNKFAKITGREFLTARKWAELVGHTDAIEGMPPRSICSPSYECGYGGGGWPRELDADEVELLEDMREARKVIIAKAGHSALMALNDTALADQPIGTDDRLRKMKDALGALDRHWGQKKGGG